MHNKTSRLAQFVQHERQEVLGFLDKAIPVEWSQCSAEDVVNQSPTINEMPTPLLTINGRALETNIATISKWSTAERVKLSPHGKTTMAPALWQKQLQAGAWGITVGNEAQLRVALLAGVPRVMLANLLLRAQGLAWVQSHLQECEDQTVYSWVDSLEAVALMEHGLQGAVRKLPVLVEVGASAGRTGARTIEAAEDVARAVHRSSVLELAGIAGYEGVITHGYDQESLDQIDQFLEKMKDLHHRIISLYERSTPIISAGGSAYFDRVAECFGGLDGVEVVVRAGATITHDDGVYIEMTPSFSRPGPVFDAALNVWSRVISIPEPGIAYLDAGRRDLSDDEGFPTVLDIRRGSVIIDAGETEVFAMNDQHTHVRLGKGSALRVGDVVRLGISHPCTTFDRWTWVPVIDDVTSPFPTVTDLIRTRF